MEENNQISVCSEEPNGNETNYSVLTLEKLKYSDIVTSDIDGETNFNLNARLNELEHVRRQYKKTKKKLKHALLKIGTLESKINSLVKKKESATVATQICQVATQTCQEDFTQITLIEAADPANYEPFTSTDESIADQLKAAAEQAISSTSFVFDESSGLYYDHSTNYYYDPEKQLYYDNSNGIYYQLDPSTNSYVYHSKVNLDKYEGYLKHIETKRKKAAKRERKAVVAARKQIGDVDGGDLGKSGGEVVMETDDAAEEEMEEGEVVSSGEEVLSSESDDQEPPEPSWRPPCVRMMVTSSQHLSAGSLYVVTITGGWIGPDDGSLVQIPDHTVQIPDHTVQIPDHTVPEDRCALQYNDSEYSYYLYLPSSNRHSSITLNEHPVNQELSSEGGYCEAWTRITHKDILCINDSTFSLHMHPGTDTCSECEPAVIQQQLAAMHNASTAHDVVAPGTLSKSDKERNRRKQLKTLKKKYGLQQDNYIQKSAALPNGYEDAAARRREKYGIEFVERDAEPASVDVALSSTNVGHKMLAKMGWKEGKSLGKNQTGIVEPVKVDMRLNQSAGLGSRSNQTATLDCGGQIKSLRNKADILKKTQKRFEASQVKAFQPEDSDSPEPETDHKS